MNRMPDRYRCAMDLSSVNFILTIGSLAILRTVGIWDFARGATANEAPYPPPECFSASKTECYGETSTHFVGYTDR